ncbi:MAG: zinc ribbon domain-containing protein [Cyanobacteria bacterium P01_H01_bin.26]
MSRCPQCHQPVAVTDVTCAHCGLELKAHGHPGIDLHRAQVGTYLCPSCVYHHDDSCTFPQRPQATTCTLYQDIQMVQDRPRAASDIYTIPWWRRHSGWLMLVGIVIVSVLITVL